MLSNRGNVYINASLVLGQNRYVVGQGGQQGLEKERQSTRQIRARASGSDGFGGLRTSQQSFVTVLEFAIVHFDHDPRTPTYIAAETPLPGTVAAFWQMVWEQFAVVIVCLEPDSSLEQVMENCLDSGRDSVDTTTQARYWPPEGCSMYGKFEVRFVSEHSSCGDFIIRSFYLKEVESGETRTITQFHFLKWLEDVPSCDVKTVLDFRRKVNKSFRAKKSPVVVHCIDGSGKTGTYLLIDLVLNRINKGVKELDVAASIEHLRDQRHGMIKSKEQFKFVLASIAEEVNSMLNAVG
ncbi:unnamed protein product [Schistocephalus solidus]|uniref:Receptor-type tyrosine-protein phosphatase-like N n=1 Tax=Schistocephalus solidus TaxID=70667 RepID=A0A3P7CYY6_SCHSO|nr:unnamed protein product [Schistocephalus solidus]